MLIWRPDFAVVLARDKYLFTWVLVVNSSYEGKMLRAGVLFTFLPFFSPLRYIRVRLKLLSLGISTWHLNLLRLYKRLKPYEIICKYSYEKSSLSLFGLYTDLNSFGEISQTCLEEQH